MSYVSIQNFIIVILNWGNFAPSSENVWRHCFIVKTGASQGFAASIQWAEDEDVAKHPTGQSPTTEN